ncbi:MAG: HAD-IIIA family hydrolase [Saprospiraceae bacterium]|nr:HAD-IIIA family hydrolase [Saprospiraceae bacterium]
MTDVCSTLFLDRDGVINRPPKDRYARSWKEFYFLPGALEAMSVLADKFDRVIIVTNQQGIGKKLMTEDDLHDIHQRMTACIEAFGGRIDGVFHCPELSEVPGNCRKPSPVMALRAKSRFPEIDFKNSLMIGDKESDLEFGINLGMEVILIENPEERIDNERFKSVPSYGSLIQFARQFSE